MKFCEDYRPYFAAARHNVSPKARAYLAGLLMKGERKNMERMEEYVEDYAYENQQQFLSDSPWDERALMRQVGGDVSEAVGGPDSAFILDESGFGKKGDSSVGVARQWNGRQGKVDNCQVGVFAALSDGKYGSLVDFRLFLPESWTSDPRRCDKAKIPEDCREYRTKPQLAWEMTQEAVANGLNFGWVSLDSLYGNTPWLLRAIEDEGLVFVADVHIDQKIYVEDPEPYLPRRRDKMGRKYTKLRGRSAPVDIESYFVRIPARSWHMIKVREGTKGDIRVRACCRRVFLWDGKEKQTRSWWAVCVIDPENGIKKYFLSNARKSATLEELVRKHSVRYWIERSFQDGKTSLGMGDYQARGWTAWHHHMALVSLAMLFVLKERLLHRREIELLSFQDIVELLNFYLPRADRTEEAVLRNIARRHRKRRASIESARRRGKRRKINGLKVTK